MTDQAQPAGPPANGSTGGDARAPLPPLPSFCYECNETCVRYARGGEHRASAWQVIQSCVPGFEEVAATVADWLLEHPATFWVVVLVGTACWPAGHEATPGWVVDGTWARDAIHMTAVTATDAAAEVGGILHRVASRWSVLLAFGGFYSAIKILDGVREKNQRYLQLDLSIDVEPAQRRFVTFTTKIDNDPKVLQRVHNAYLLVGPADTEPNAMLEALALAAPNAPIRQRISCGTKLDTWWLDSRIIGTGESEYFQAGQRWPEWGSLRGMSRWLWAKVRTFVGAKPDPSASPAPRHEFVQCLLAACPPPRAVYTATIDNCAVVLTGVPFYYDENDEIADEKLSAPVVLEASHFVPGRPYIARFYVMPTMPDRAFEAMSRCTAKAFIIPDTAASTRSSTAESHNA